MTRTATVIVLAAGKGERFKASGGTIDKLETLLCGQRVRDHVLASVKASGLPFQVVEREHTSHLPNPGLSDSIACGVKATENSNGWLSFPADLPLIQPTTLLAVAAALKQHSVVVPIYDKHPGHPVGFNLNCRNSLAHLTGDKGARSIVDRHSVHRLETSDKGCVLDVDTVDTLALAAQHINSSKNTYITTY